MRIEFDKMEGAGNDFIFIDDRGERIPGDLRREWAVRYCRRALGIGADGMVFIANDPEFDFTWDFYNADGSIAEMCGNGARCAARYAHKIGAAGPAMTFRTLAGPIHAELTPAGAKVRLTDALLPAGAETIYLDGRPIDVYFLNTGVPHAVMEVSDLEMVNVRELGLAIRHHPHFAPAGTNVNFIRPETGDAVTVRTYERGVEAETLACGTGSVAASLVAALFYGKKSPVAVATRGGELTVHFRIDGGRATDIYLEGSANTVFTGYFEG